MLISCSVSANDLIHAQAQVSAGPSTAAIWSYADVDSPTDSLAVAAACRSMPAAYWWNTASTAPAFC
jgi:hypothetical protein